MLLTQIPNLIHELSFLLLVFAFHELGHYAFYDFYNYRPDFKINIFGFFMGSNVWKRLTIYQAIFTDLAGILLGYLPIILCEFNLIWNLYYFILCSYDLFVLIILIFVKNKNKTIGDLDAI